jgi:hypothetical protein
MRCYPFPLCLVVATVARLSDPLGGLFYQTAVYVILPEYWIISG